jgi:hypothetical protein
MLRAVRSGPTGKCTLTASVVRVFYDRVWKASAPARVSSWDDGPLKLSGETSGIDTCAPGADWRP